MHVRWSDRDVRGAVLWAGYWDLHSRRLFPCIVAALPAPPAGLSKCNSSRSLLMHSSFRRATQKLPCGLTTVRFRGHF